MKEHDVENVFVVGHERRFRGLVPFDDVLEAIRAGRELEEIVITDVPSVAPDATLSDIISLIVGGPYPVAVVDDRGRLRGFISQSAILGALARNGERSRAVA